MTQSELINAQYYDLSDVELSRIEVLWTESHGILRNMMPLKQLRTLALDELHPLDNDPAIEDIM